MRSLQLVGLGSFLCVAFACSNGADGTTTSSPGSSGSESTSGTATTAGTPSTAVGGSSAAGSLNLGGNITAEQGGTGAEPTAPELQSDVNVIITADNAYGFGYGTQTQMVNYSGGVENPNSADIFDCPVGTGPEQYVVPAADANAGGYLYIIGYADQQTSQGVLAKFFREGGQPVYTGAGKWEACATGEDYAPGSGGPDLAAINSYILKCNAGELDPATSSVGWVNSTGTTNGKVAFGEDNSTARAAMAMPGNEFRIACEIEPTAHWMWFDWEPARTAGSPFLWPGGTDNVIKDFVIFRLGADQIPRKPPA